MHLLCLSSLRFSVINNEDLLRKLQMYSMQSYMTAAKTSFRSCRLSFWFHLNFHLLISCLLGQVADENILRYSHPQPILIGKQLLTKNSNKTRSDSEEERQPMLTLPMQEHMRHFCSFLNISKTNAYLLKKLFDEHPKFSQSPMQLSFAISDIEISPSGGSNTAQLVSTTAYGSITSAITIGESNISFYLRRDYWRTFQ